MSYHIEKNSVQETLVIPLYGRKLCTELFPNLFRDYKAVELINRIAYDFSELDKRSKSLAYRFGALEVAMRENDLMIEAKDSWNMDFLPCPDGSGYEARFYKCGICVLMTELGISGYIPAMCRLDYTMSELGGADDFVREYTLASGGPYCDCGYKKKGVSK